MSNNSVLYFSYDSHYVSVNLFTIRTGIFPSGIPITGTNYYLYTVIVNPELAGALYTPRFFYVQYEMKKWSKQNPQANAQRKAVARKRFRAAWEEEKAKDPKFGEMYEKKFRDHEERQKGTKDELVDVLNRNGRRSYLHLEKAINGWCSYKLKGS